MLLGSLLHQLQDERFVAQILFTLGDITLAGRLGQEAARHGESAGEYAAGACARFSGGASDEDWLALMTALERGGDPAAVCLRNMLEWSLKADAEPRAASAHEGCGCGTGACEGEQHGPG